MRTVFVIGIGATLLLFGLAGPLAMAGQDAKTPTPEKKTLTQKKETPAQKKLEKKSGKELYRLTCKPCHLPKSPAGEYTPMTLIQEQWEDFFDNTYAGIHEALVDSVEARPDWATPELIQKLEQLTPKMLEKIRKFAVDHAADSEHPMTCG